MPAFRYTILAQGAHDASNVIEAPDRASAIRLLRLRGITPTRLEPVSDRPASHNGHLAAPTTTTAATDAGARPGPRRLHSGVSRSEMASFVRELATAVSAGLPLVQALATIKRSSRNQRVKDMLGFLIREVEHGRSLADAAADWGKPFSNLTVSLLRAGESSGRLPDILKQAADLLDRDVKLRRGVLAATTYPMILGVLVIIAVTVVATFIVPGILKPMLGQVTVAQLPLPTRMVLAVTGFVSSYWWLVLLALAAALFSWAQLMKKPGFRLGVHRGLLATPVLGRLIRDVAVGRFTRTLGTLVSSGLPLIQSLRVTRDTLGNAALQRVVDEVCVSVAGGESIAEPMERSGQFPPLLVQIVSVGERSGRLPEMLYQAADAFEDRTEVSMKLFTAALPPVLVVIAAVVIGFVIAAVMLPLIQMQEFIG